MFLNKTWLADVTGAGVLGQRARNERRVRLEISIPDPDKTDVVKKKTNVSKHI